MSKTSIEWATDVWNPVTGCTKVSEGCRHCYAEMMAKRTFGRLYSPISMMDGNVSVDKLPESALEDADRQSMLRPRRFTDVQCHHDRLDRPLRWRKPRRVFVNSMSDLFHEDVPDEFICRVWGAMHAAKGHQFLVLTKRPERMRNFCAVSAEDGGPAVPSTNVWLGVSVEDQATADARIPLLLQTPAAVRFVSVEPMLGPVDLRNLPFPGAMARICDSLTCGTKSPTPWNVSWVICGGESGPKARPMHPDWVRSLRDQCKGAGVPFFFKQWGAWCPLGVADKKDEDRSPVRMVNVDGGHAGGIEVVRVGKKKAGNLLDGERWEQFPEVAGVAP